MKILAGITGGFIGLILIFLILQTLASERIEVVELTTTNELNENIVTRLWVVDDDGYQYLRVGATGSGWFDRLKSSDTVLVRRGDTLQRYKTLTRPDKSELINQLMREKYTWGDTFFATLFGGRQGSIPIELHLYPE